MAKKATSADTTSKVRVRVIGKQPLSEDGTTYYPKRQENIGGKSVTTPADEFEVTADRAEALGDSVEIISGNTAPG